MNEQFMQMALDLASKGRGKVSPNPMVGAVVVADGEVVGKGYHAQFGGDHAEAAALKNAGGKARGADIYVTLEPCNHEGKTGKCTEKILNAGIKRVFAAADDPNPDVEGSGNDFLRQNGVEVETGILKEEAEYQNRFFLKHITEKLPWVVLKWAMSLDGATGTTSGDSKWISGKESRKAVHRMRAEMDAVCVGAGTVRADDPMLTVRDADGSNPVRVIIDPNLTTPLDSNLVKSADDAKLVLMAGENAPVDTIAQMEDLGIGVHKVGSQDGILDIREILTLIGEHGHMSMLVEGGGTTAGYFIDQGMADECAVFIAPSLIGGNAKRPLLGEGIGSMNERITLRNIRTEMYDSDICIKGLIEK